MSPLIDSETRLEDLPGSRYISDGSKIAYAPYNGRGEDVGLGHKELAVKYNLYREFSGGKPIVYAGGWIGATGEPEKLYFTNNTTGCEVAGDKNDQRKALSKVHKIAKGLLGNDKVENLLDKLP